MLNPSVPTKLTDNTGSSDGFAVPFDDFAGRFKRTIQSLVKPIFLC